MPTVSDLLDHCNSRFPLAKAAEWDRVGLQVGDPAAPAERIGVAHELTPVVVDAALDGSIDTLVAYHPLIFRPLSRLTPGSDPGGLAWRLVRGGVGVIVAHTAFDVATGGSADSLAEILGLSDSRPFGPVWGADAAKVVTFVPVDDADSVAAAMADAGAGQIGLYEHCSFRIDGTGTFRAREGASPSVGEVGTHTDVAEQRVEMVVGRSAVDAVVAALVVAHPYEEPAYDVYERSGDAGFLGRIGTAGGDFDALVERVGSTVGGVVRVAGRAPGSEMTVAVVPGSGGSLLAAAAVAGAQVAVTGDVKHHDARAANARGMAVIDPGHAATERPGTASLYAAVSAGFDDVVDLTALDADPWAAPQPE